MLLLALAAGGCRGCGQDQDRADGDAGVGTGASAAPRADASTAATASAGPWQEAAAGDGLALARLAELYDAAELWAVAAEPGPRAGAALEALTRSDDAERVLGAMAEAAAEASERREELLRALVQLASRPPRRGEALDAPSVARCIAALDVLARDEAVARRDRALAVTALRALARAGYLDPASVPSAVDPPSAR